MACRRGLSPRLETARLQYVWLGLLSRLSGSLACRVVIRHRLGSRLVLGDAVRLSKLYYAWWMQQPAETLSDARLKHMIHRQAGRSVNCHGFIASIVLSSTITWPRTVAKRPCGAVCGCWRCIIVGTWAATMTVVCSMKMDGTAMISRPDDALSGYECNISTSLQTLP